MKISGRKITSLWGTSWERGRVQYVFIMGNLVGKGEGGICLHYEEPRGKGEGWNMSFFNV